MISIIIPCYNQGAYIQDAIDSVLAQTYTNWEIIIVNDGSNDVETLCVLNDLSNKSILIINQENKGVSVARNNGAKYANGELLLFLDGDDKIEKNYLKLAVDAFNKNSTLSYVYCDIQEFGDENNYRSIEQLDLRKTLLNNQTHVSGILKKDLWLSSKGFDESFKKGWEDWDFMISILKLDFEFYKIPAPMLLYRILQNSRDTNALAEHEKELKNQIYLKHIESYFKYFDEPITLLRNNVAQQIEILHLKENTKNIYNTFSYKLGSLILYPFKIINKIFFEKKA